MVLFTSCVQFSKSSILFCKQNFNPSVVMKEVYDVEFSPVTKEGVVFRATSFAPQKFRKTEENAHFISKTDLSSFLLKKMTSIVY